jgi:two-component system, cell cycle sensor histidine kinase and response regulator CckA
VSEKRILVVEDEQIVAMDIKLHLERFGYRVPQVCASGEEALEAARVVQPDLVIMDIKLQGRLDGLETANQIKDEHDIPVILLTAYADENTLERAKYTQPFGYIIKPFEERELRTTIVMALYRHTMERELVQRERLFATTLRSISDCVVVSDTEGTVTYMNPAAQKVFQKGSETWTGTMDELFSINETDSPEDIAYMETAEGVRFPVEYTLAPLRDERNTSNGTVLVFSDITDKLEARAALKRSEERLRQSQKMEAVGRLTGGIAHDFNNLLTAILGYTKLILLDGEKPEDLDLSRVLSDVEGIRNVATKSAGLTRKLLAFSRQNVVKPKPVHLSDVVKDLDKLMHGLLNPGISIQIQLERDRSCIVMVDVGLIEQVVLNLVVNARDAMKDGGVVRVETGMKFLDKECHCQTGVLPAGGYGTIKVSDTGAGIPEDLMPRIFEPFFTTKSEEQGTGLGLATVYGIVVQMSGGIEVESSADTGTEFTVYLPLCTAEDNEVLQSVPVTQISITGTETILLVEDALSVQKPLKRILERSEFNVIEARNAGEALLICEFHRREIDLVITDAVMPYISGEELVSRLRGFRSGLKALFTSGHPEVLEHVPDLDDVWYLQKPFELEEFTRMVRNILDV